MATRIGRAASSANTNNSRGVSLPIGVTLMTLGGVLALLAAWHYHMVNRAIDHGSVRANRELVIFVTLMVTVLCAAMIAYMLVTAQHT